MSIFSTNVVNVFGVCSFGSALHIDMLNSDVLPDRWFFLFSGIIFGNIVYDGAGPANERSCVILNDIHIDIMDYIRFAVKHH